MATNAELQQRVDDLEAELELLKEEHAKELQDKQNELDAASQSTASSTDTIHRLTEEREDLVRQRDEALARNQETVAALEETIRTRDELAQHVEGDAAERPVTVFDKYDNWLDPFSGLVIAEGTKVSPRSGAELVERDGEYFAVMRPVARGLEEER